MFKNAKNLSTRLIASVVMVLIVVLTGFTVIQWRERSSQVSEQLSKQARELNDTLDTTLRHAMIKVDQEAIESMLARLKTMPTTKRVLMLNEEHKVTRSTDPQALETKPLETDLATIKTTRQGIFEMRQTEDGKPYMLALSPVNAEQSCLECHSAVKLGEPAGYLAFERWAIEDMAATNASQRTLVLMHIATILILCVCLFWVVKNITRPLITISSAATSIAKGDVDQVLAHKSNDEIGVLADSFRDIVAYLKSLASTGESLSQGDLTIEVAPRSEKDALSHAFRHIIDSLRLLSAETRSLAEAAVAGNLSKRGDTARLEGGYREIVQGMNDTLDAVIGPLTVAATCVDRISKGDIPEKITENYRGDFNKIKDNLNTCVTAVNALVADARMLSQAAVEGKLATRADASRHQGDFRAIVQGVNNTLDAVIGPLTVAAKYVDRISKGDIPAKITDTYNGDFNEIKNNLNTCVDAVNALVADTNILSQAAVQGKLATRADATRHHGDFQVIVQGVNGTLDAVIGPLNIAAKYMDRISKGDIPAKITDSYNGDFNEIKNNLNTCVDAVNALVADARMLAMAAVEGKLGTRADATRHHGDFRVIVQGVNETLDAVIGPLNVAAKYVDRISKGDIPAKITDTYSGDFNEIKNNLNTCVDAVNALVADTRMLAKAAVEGKLATRADESRHLGDFRAIVQGVNETLDAVIGPLRVAADYVDRISKGDIPKKIADAYNGDFNEIKNNLNTCIDAVNALVADAKMLSQAAVEGKLATRADAARHQGDFRTIVQGVNGTLDAVIGPLSVAARYVDRISKGDIPEKITNSYNGDFNEIKNNLNTCIDAVNLLVSDAKMLSRAAVAGNLATRADATRHSGDFRAIVQGVNDTLDAVIGPLKVAAGYVDQIARGDIPAKIAASYNGDFNEIKNNLNICIDAINSLVADAGMLVDAAVAGRLQTRAEASKHLGKYKQIVQGVNDTLDAVLNPITEASAVLERVAARDLTARIQGNYLGDHAKIKEALNQAVANLDEGLIAVSIATDQVATAATQIAGSSESLAHGSSEQASALEEVGSSLAEMQSITRRNSKNAQQTKTMAEAAVEGAAKGLNSMHNLSEAMDRIKQSSDQTAKIIKTIDEIAFQTNLLALNAAVEAARAGEAGKGFAVVAEEVRNLAMRSAEAAKNTADLIEGSVKNANYGVEANREVEHSLKEIHGQVRKVSDVMNEIVVASEQQSTGIAQVNTAVEQMNQVTQQSAAGSEEMASVAKGLSVEADDQRNMVASFKLSNGSRYQAGLAKKNAFGSSEF
jgi:methyl-accepting chemotaxis protein